MKFLGPQSGRERSSLALLSPDSFFRRGTKGWPRTTSAELEAQKTKSVYGTTYAQRAINQLNYSKTSRSGKFYGYAGTGYGASGEEDQTVFNFEGYTYPLYFVPPGTSTVKVWFVKQTNEEELRPEGAFNDLQAAIEAVPMPDPTKVYKPITKEEEEQGVTPLTSIGTDEYCTIYDLATDTLYEFHRLRKFLSGSHAGEWKCEFAGVLKEASKSLGAFPVMPAGEAPGDGTPWGGSASGLVLPALTLTIQDIIDVLRGKPIRHALGFSAEVRENAHLAPADKNDYGNDGVPKEKSKELNPAWAAKAPYPDEIPEGLALCFPEGSEPQEHGITTPLAEAIYRAIRDYGMFLHDGAGATAFQVEDLGVLGSPYSWAHVNPFYDMTSAGPTEEQINGYLANFYAAIPGGWRDESLPQFTEDFVSKHSVLFDQPWELLEQLQPAST